MESIQETVLRVIGQITGSTLTLQMDSSLSEMRVNSIKIIQIIAALEKDLDFELDDEDLVMSNFSTPGQTIKLIREKYRSVESA